MEIMDGGVKDRETIPSRLCAHKFHPNPQAFQRYMEDILEKIYIKGVKLHTLIKIPRQNIKIPERSTNKVKRS